MEEIFELIAVLIVIVVGVAAKSGKKKKGPEKARQPVQSAWDELNAGADKRFAEFIEKRDGEPVIPYAPVQPAAPQVQPAMTNILPVQPAAPDVMPVQPAAQAVNITDAQNAPVIRTEDGSMGGISMEGVSMEGAAAPARKPRPRSKKQAEQVSSAHSAAGRRLVPEKLTVGTLRSAFVMSEVLGKPLALRNTARR